MATAYRRRRYGNCGIGLAILLSFLFGHAAIAAERWTGLAETVFRNYGREQGLPHPVPVSLAQDREGFIWVGTQGGLARWDGYRFRAYEPDAAVPGSLPDSYIQTLHVDPAGRLWVGMGAGGLARYDRDRDDFVPVAVPGNGRIHIGALADDGAGGLWIGTDTGLDHLDAGAAAATADGAIEGHVQALLRDRDGRLWIGTTKGLLRRDPGAAGFATVALAPDTANVTALLQDGGGRIWAGTTRGGLFAIDGPEALPRSIGVSPLLGNGWVSALCDAGGGELWVAFRGAGIVSLDAATGRWHGIRHDRTLPQSLAHDDVWALMRDAAGSLWVGGTGGLSYHVRALAPVATVFGAAERGGGLSDSDVYSVMAAADGRVWLGYVAGGVDIVDPVAGRVATLSPDPGHGDTALPADVVLAMAEASDGTVYIGTRRGLYRAAPDGRGVALVAVPGRDPRAAVGSLTVDAGILWIGGYDDGLWGLRLDGGGLAFGPAESAGLSNQIVDVIRRGAGDDLWIGTHEGLNRIDLATHAIERILPAPGDPAGLPSQFIASMLVDRQGRLWIGTFGGGIAILTGRDAGSRPIFRRLGLADGLPHANVDTVLADGDGTIWAGTDDGLAVIDPASLAIRRVNKAEGAVLVDYFVNSGATDAAGEALFGAKGGLTVVRPGGLPAWTLRPPIVVSDIRVGGVPVPIGRFNGGVVAAPLVLTPETNSLAVEFAALDFTAPERNRYAYRLDGFDRDWHDSDPSRRLAAYTNLPPGSYTLRLHGTNRDGLPGERDLALSIRVLPAWYQTLWFKLLGVAVAIVAVTLLVRRRTAYLRRRQGELEREIAAHTADLRAANQRLVLLATTDPLTGCANRRHFMERAHDLIALANRHCTPLTLAVMDLDEFKRVNDTHGHPAGDAVLGMAGRVLQGHVRATDLLGRVGGEEFALLMPHTDVAGGYLLADRLRQAIGEGVVEADGTCIRVTVSLGLAQLRRGEDFDTLYARTDAALYAAKQAGRNRVETAAAG